MLGEITNKVYKKLMKIKREQLIYYSVKYQGNYSSIVKALRSKESYYYLDIKAITCVDDDYPEIFWQLRHPPLCLFYLGNKELLKRTMIGIVGSRIIDEKNHDEIKLLVKNLNCAYDIVSGLAKGVDGIALQAAIDDGRSGIAVLGNGIDYCYPRENQLLYQELSTNHLVLSEYPEFTKPQKQNFPFRNRIIAALSDKLIIPVCGLKSGTQHSVNYALELGKCIYCLPQGFDDKLVGSNHLIKQGANIICDINDVRSI